MSENCVYNDTIFLDEEYERIDILSIEIIKNDKKVYDIEVEDNKTFCISKEDIIVHNCDMGRRAQEIGIFFRTFDNALENTNIGFIYTNKLYTNFGNIYDPWKSVGGENVFYNSSLILRLATSSETDDVSESEIKADKKNKNTSLGNTYTTSMCRITKSRFGTKNRSCQYLIDSQFGLTRYSGLFRLLSDFKIIISPSSGWYALPALWGEEKFRKKDFISLFRKDETENVLKLQKALDAREEEIKNERREFNETGVADVEESQDLQDEEDILMEEILGETE